MKYKLSYVQVIALGYIIMIAVGTTLLMMPFSSVSGEFTPFTTSLFTATSASCVTGLVLVDTATYWSLAGQIVIICLIQIGGLGFMSIATVFFMMMRRRIGLREKELMIESINSSTIGGVLKLTKKIIIGTLLFEGTGAVILSVRFLESFSPGKAIYYGIFHAISSFCNAGFDLFGIREPFSSFVSFADDTVLNVTIMALIIVGGIGFLVWDDIARNGLHFRHYNLHTKMVLITSVILTFGGAFLLWIFERGNTCANMTTKEQILTSLFGSVTARTAGFNTVDTAALSDGGKLLTMILMFIGGSSGSTAGGIKTTTIAVLILHVVATMTHKAYPSAFGRKIGDDAVKKAVTVMLTNLILIITGVMIICAVQASPLSDVLFETFSAIGTVGMTTGYTRELLPVSQYVIIFLMYLGRVGSISFAAALLQKKALTSIQPPQENVIIG